MSDGRGGIGFEAAVAVVTIACAVMLARTMGGESHQQTKRNVLIAAVIALTVARLVRAIHEADLGFSWIPDWLLDSGLWFTVVVSALVPVISLVGALDAKAPRAEAAAKAVEFGRAR